MSVRAVSAVIASSIKPPTVKLTAVVMAEAMNERTGQLNLSLATIAARVGVSRDQARRCVHALISDHVLSVIANAAGGAPGAVPFYQMHLDRLPQSMPTDGTDATPGAGGTDGTHATPTDGTDATPGAAGTGSTGAADGWHLCSGRVAPVRPTGGMGATRTRRNQKEPEVNQQPTTESSVPKLKRRRIAASSEVTLSAWLEAEAAAGRQAVPGDDPIFAYADKIGLPREFLRLAWSEFKAKFTAPPTTGKGLKKYIDWREVFRNYCRRGWLDLWRLNGQQYLLTTAGQQAARAHQNDAALAISEKRHHSGDVFQNAI